MKRITAAMLTLAVLLICVGCAAPAFVGSRQSSEYRFHLDYTALNEETSGELILAAGDSLCVDIRQTEGTVDLTVGISGEAPIYQGNDLTEIQFTLNIPASGNYCVSVSGHKAVGSVTVEKVIPDGDSPNGSTQPVADFDRAAALEAYQFILEQFSFEHIYPDGTDTGFDGSVGFIEDNDFALYDVNGDGLEELIIRFVTAPTEAKLEIVYTFRDGGPAVILSAFPEVTYFSNDILQEDWFHGSDLAGEGYWPYNLYRLNCDGFYELFAEVNMWSRDVDMVNAKGDPYPEDIDRENAGTVFIVTREGKTETISKSDYETWLSSLLEDAQQVTIPYQAMTEENIRNLTR